MHSPARLSAFVVLFTACALQPRTSQIPPAESQIRSRIVPLVEYHQHVVGPTALAHLYPPQAPIPAAQLPPELDRLLREREKINGTGEVDTLFTDSAQILDISEGEDHWSRGREAAEIMAGAYGPKTRFVANAYALGDAAGWIAGTVPRDDSTVSMHFLFGLKRDSTRSWRIALEYATTKPPNEFHGPITSEKVIQVLNDAAIQRAVVLSVAYWIGDGNEKVSIEEEYTKVRAENDWMVQQVLAHPGRLVGFCGVNPLRDYAIREIERCAKLPGVKGMKLHFGNSRINVKNPAHVEKLRAFFRSANMSRMAIVAHLWTNDRTYGRDQSTIFLNQILPEAADVTVQIAHMAGAGRYAHDDAMAVFAEASAAKDRRMKNVYFDLATVVTETQSQKTLDLIASRIRQVGPDRILYGSDTPGPTRPPPIQGWATVKRRLSLTSDELATIASNVAPYLR